MKNYIANAYLGQKAAKKMNNDIAEKTLRKNENKVTLLAAAMMSRAIS